MPELRDDIYRHLLREPPDTEDPAAHLVWLRLLARVLVELDHLAPHAVTVLCADPAGPDVLSRFGRIGAYEQAMSEAIPLSTAFLARMDEIGVPKPVADLLRTETWLGLLQSADAIPASFEVILGVRREGERSVLAVGHDALSSLQAVVGWRETTLGRADRLLWHLGFAPVQPRIEAMPCAGYIVFDGTGPDASCFFLPLDQIR